MGDCWVQILLFKSAGCRSWYAHFGLRVPFPFSLTFTGEPRCCKPGAASVRVPLLRANVRPQFDQCPPLPLLLFVLSRHMQGQPSGSAKFCFSFTAAATAFRFDIYPRKSKGSCARTACTVFFLRPGTGQTRNKSVFSVHFFSHHGYSGK